MQEKHLNELLKNETFINYCLKRNKRDINDWEIRIEENPETKAQLEELKVLVLAMGHHAGQKAIAQNYLKLRNLINQGYALKKRYILFFFGWISSAAAIIVLPVFFVFYSLTSNVLRQSLSLIRFLDTYSVKHNVFHKPAGHPENSLIYSAKYRPDDYAFNHVSKVM
ncbi:hypothetical protein HDF26_002031 [Pedobacter cryoconitis]|uniref:hypothetical protein n=1 Tax=Pedobacter cryoconitis TaxID=188932 RepID=UPI00160FE6D8|nr:hypothetical protein [Pedobacter cryoconitis]MBB6271574.1 hypothetical protein [Pedobacter cryoconitis]